MRTRRKSRFVCLSLVYSFFQSLLVNFLNTIGGVTADSKSFWAKEMPRLLLEQYGQVVLLESDFGRGDDFKSRFAVPLVQQLLGEAMGAIWTSDNVLAPILELGSQLNQFNITHIFKPVYVCPVQKTDLLCMEPRISTAPLANWLDGRAKLQQAYQLLDKLSLQTSLRVIDSARVSFTEQDPSPEASLKWK